MAGSAAFMDLTASFNFFESTIPFKKVDPTFHKSQTNIHKLRTMTATVIDTSTTATVSLELTLNSPISLTVVSMKNSKLVD